MLPHPSLPFIVVHLAGGVFALVTFARVMDERLQLRVLVEAFFERNLGAPTSGGSGVAVWVLAGAVAAGALGAVDRLFDLARRRCEPTPVVDPALHLRAAVFLASVCIALCALVLSTAESYAGPFRVRYPILAECAAALAYGAFAWWSILLGHLRRLVPSWARRGLAGLALSLPILLVGGELGLRLVRRAWPNPILVTESASSQIRRTAGRRAPGSLLYGFPLNSDGHYDREFVPRAELGGPLVVSIGDSFSYGTVPQPLHFTSVCERELEGVEVYNMGYPATGPSDYLHLLEHEALPLDPDLILVQLFVGNDIDTPDDQATPPGWYDADRYLAAIVFFRLQNLRRGAAAGGSDAADSLEQALSQPWLANPLLEEPSLSEEIFLEVETAVAVAMCERQDGLAWSLRHVEFLKSLVRLERAAGDVPLAFVLIPDEFQVEDDLFALVQQRSGLELDRDLPQRETKSWAEGHGRAMLDLLPSLRAIEPLPDGDRHVYHRRNMHFNARGNEVAGRVLADFVRGLLDGTASAGEPYPLSRDLPGAEEAMPTVSAFGEVLESLALDGEEVFDLSLLDAPKTQIRDAVLGLLRTVGAGEDRTNLSNAALLLAYFQEGVGEEPAGLGDSAPDGVPWRERVHAEMVDLTLSIEMLEE
ncbi:MAG: hypothetical protein QF903_01745 [Planctomycetota bacterium]|jgi:hypothetical protein|nr:hypothetical protein [Planctomycetota bacterium]MDP6764311.1 hypothetical protein [Planctomycetota bacterium]MDP6988187.1 hypothetical protein [Planctomycetota bacterium]